MLHRYETLRDCRTTIPLTALKVSTLYIIHCDFYRYPNTQNRMCELCTFSRIRSLISNYMIGWYLTDEALIIVYKLHMYGLFGSLQDIGMHK